MKRLRVALDARKLRDFGIGTYVRGLLGAAAARGEHELVALVRSGDEALLPDGRRSDPLRCRRVLPRRARRGAARAFARAGCDVFHAPHYVVPLFPPRATVVTIHDLIHLKRPEHGTLAKRLYATTMLRRALRAARVVLTVSEAVRGDLASLRPGARGEGARRPERRGEAVSRSRARGRRRPRAPRGRPRRARTSSSSGTTSPTRTSTASSRRSRASPGRGFPTGSSSPGEPPNGARPGPPPPGRPASQTVSSTSGSSPIPTSSRSWPEPRRSRCPRSSKASAFPSSRPRPSERPSSAPTAAGCRRRRATRRSWRAPTTPDALARRARPAPDGRGPGGPPLRARPGAGPGLHLGRGLRAGRQSPGGMRRRGREGRPRPRLADRDARRREGPPPARPALPEGAALHALPLSGVGPSRDRGPARDGRRGSSASSPASGTTGRSSRSTSSPPRAGTSRASTS